MIWNNALEIQFRRYAYASSALGKKNSFASTKGNPYFAALRVQPKIKK
ncbi:hypothetical protein EV05_1978 [Prochlorococcus sp. MIT 0601]|nr:hypothetical protein EV05_1978 [Prochlorococcus sp. MIT 0601]